MPIVLLLLVVLLLWECSLLLQIQTVVWRVIFVGLGGIMLFGVTAMSQETYLKVFGHAFYFVLYNVLLFWFICWVDWGSTMRHFWESRSKNAPSQSQYAISIKISSSSRTARVLLCIGCLVVVVSLCVTFYGLHAHFGPVILLYVLCVAWATDTSAYFVGRAFGKRRLARRISPKKTIEGTIGGCLLGLIVALIPGFLWIQPNLGWSNFGVITVACVLPFLSVFGDLLESVLKRISDAKDSGSILPGHGGLLDRIDSLLVAAPFMFVSSILFS